MPTRRDDDRRWVQLVNGVAEPDQSARGAARRGYARARSGSPRGPRGGLGPISRWGHGLTAIPWGPRHRQEDGNAGCRGSDESAVPTLWRQAVVSWTVSARPAGACQRHRSFVSRGTSADSGGGSRVPRATPDGCRPLPGSGRRGRTMLPPGLPCTGSAGARISSVATAARRALRLVSWPRAGLRHRSSAHPGRDPTSA